MSLNSLLNEKQSWKLLRERSCWASGRKKNSDDVKLPDGPERTILLRVARESGAWWLKSTVNCYPVFYICVQELLAGWLLAAGCWFRGRNPTMTSCFRRRLDSANMPAFREKGKNVQIIGRWRYASRDDHRRSSFITSVVTSIKRHIFGAHIVLFNDQVTKPASTKGQCGSLFPFFFVHVIGRLRKRK